MNQRGRDESLVIINQLLLSAERGAWQKVVTDAEELRAAIVAEPFVLHVKQRGNALVHGDTAIDNALNKPRINLRRLCCCHRIASI
jgi:hypothetical protein